MGDIKLISERGNEIVIRKGFSYSIRTGELVMREGYALVKHWRNEIMDTSNFYFGDPRKHSSFIPHISVLLKPGVVRQMAVWLEERDDVIAAKLLIARELEQIEELQNEIVKHDLRIFALNKIIQ